MKGYVPSGVCVWSDLLREKSARRSGACGQFGNGTSVGSTEFSLEVRVSRADGVLPDVARDHINVGCPARRTPRPAAKRPPSPARVRGFLRLREAILGRSAATLSPARGDGFLRLGEATPSAPAGLHWVFRRQA